MATSSSADGGLARASAVAAAAAAHVCIAAVAVVLAVVVADSGWLPALVVAAAAVAIVAVSAAAVLPRRRRRRELEDAAARLASLDFDARAETDGGEFGTLASTINAAAATIGVLVASLRQERAQLERLLNASSDAIVAVDRHATVAYTNDAARRLFGVADPDARRAFIAMVRDHDLNELVVAAARRAERSVRVVPYGAQQRWLQATAVPIDGGGDWAALAVFHDLTEVRRLDAMRRDFISNVSHELRTPLAGIRAAAETLQEGALDDRPAAIEFLGHIQREADRMTQLVEELLELSRIESGAAPMIFREMDAAILAESTARRFAQQAERAGLRIVAAVSEPPLPVVGDAERLERALGNLVANAIRFTEAGGLITIGARAAGDSVTLDVTDTGIGIEPELQSRVFERFYKADRGRGETGTGLGLAIVKHIALAHGGTVGVESRPGRGSTFSIRLPRR